MEEEESTSAGGEKEKPKYEAFFPDGIDAAKEDEIAQVKRRTGLESLSFQWRWCSKMLMAFDRDSCRVPFCPHALRMSTLERLIPQPSSKSSPAQTLNRKCPK